MQIGKKGGRNGEVESERETVETSGGMEAWHYLNCLNILYPNVPRNGGQISSSSYNYTLHLQAISLLGQVKIPLL